MQQPPKLIPTIRYPIQNVSKIRKGVSIILVIVLYQLITFFMFFVCLYAIIYVNYQLIIGLIIISLLQSRVPRSEFYIKCVKKYVQPLNFFRKFQKYYQQPIQQGTKCLFSFHPHSVLSFGFLADINSGDDIASSLTGLSSRFMLNIPVVGLLLRIWGIQAVNPENLEVLMKAGKPIGLLPGGFQQATITTPKQYRIYIKQRKGFIKYALKNKYKIFPTLVLNEHKAFWTFDYLLKFRFLLNKIKIPGVWFIGPLGIVLPPNYQLITIFGRGISGNSQASKQQIQRCHYEYVQEIKRIYNKYRHLNNNSQLVIY